MLSSLRLVWDRVLLGAAAQGSSVQLSWTWEWAQALTPRRRLLLRPDSDTSLCRSFQVPTQARHACQIQLRDILVVNQ